MAVDVLTGWLTLQDARASERKRELARVAISGAMPRIRSKVDLLRAIDRSPIDARNAILALEG